MTSHSTPLRGLRSGVLALAAAALMAVPGTVHAQANAGGASLQIPPGARAEGMGRFFNSVSDDAFAPWWNPAGLAFQTGWNVGLMHTKLVPDLADDVFFEYLGGSKYIQGWGGVAATITYLSYGESFATDPDSPDPTGTFSSFEFSPSVAMGTRIVNNLGLGANLKLLHVNLAPDNIASGGKGTTFAVDLGGLYNIPGTSENFFGLGATEYNIGLGVTVANLGPDISLASGQQSDPLPRNLKVGTSFGARTANKTSFLLGVAMEKSLVFEDIPDSIKAGLSFAEKNELLFSGGLEVGIMDLAYGRVGYIYDDVGEIKGATYGAGFYIKNFGLDFASIPQFRELNRVTKISIVARFD